MSERSQHRRPATFKLDDPGVIVVDADDASRPARGTVHVTPETEPALLPVPVEAQVLPTRRGFRWGTVFWSAVGGLTLAPAAGSSAASTRSIRRPTPVAGSRP